MTTLLEFIMLYHLLTPLSEQFIIFNLFQYLTFRTGGAIMTALIIGFIIGPRVITWLKTKQGAGQPLREIGPDHAHKHGTPTMGGLMILISAGISTLLWADLTNIYIWMVLGVFLGFGAIGFADDYKKLTKRSHAGVSGKARLALECAIALAAVGAILTVSDWAFSTGLAIPFVKDFLLPLGLFFIPFAVLVIVGASNAVNLTDGLDGLATGCTISVALSYALLAYLAGHYFMSVEYLVIPHNLYIGELAVFLMALAGACFGFLWFNCHPAKVFMGDTGSLAIGGALATAAICTKQELLLIIIGGVFVMEAMSVILQVGSFKLRRKRIFRMSPIHHHFELLGWHESQVIIRFWILSIMLALFGLAILKIV